MKIIVKVGKSIKPDYTLYERISEHVYEKILKTNRYRSANLINIFKSFQCLQKWHHCTVKTL